MPTFINTVIPPVGLGTVTSPSEDTFNAIVSAVQMGYRHIDLSPRYGNQEEIGRAIKKCIELGHIKSRKELILTSKLYHTCHREDLILKQLDSILEELETDYLDYFLMHAPWAFQPKNPQKVDWQPAEDKFGAILENIPYTECWSNMLKLCPRSKARHLGVSNFSAKMLDACFRKTGVYPCINQVECHLLLQQDDLLDYCRAKGIQLIAYAPTGEGRVKIEDLPLREHPVVKKIADNKNCTPTQIILRYHYERGIITIPKSCNPKHILENFKSTDENLELTYDEFQKLKDINENKRFFGQNWIGKVSPENYPYFDKF